MKCLACGVAAFRAATAATTLAIVLVMVTPAAATLVPPVKVGGEVAVSPNVPLFQTNPDAARRPDGTYVAVWTSYKDTNNADDRGVYMQLYGKDRAPIGVQQQVSATTLIRSPRVAIAANNSFVVVWVSSHDGTTSFLTHAVLSQRFTADGVKIGEVVQVSTGSAAAINGDVAFLVNGGVVFCWSEQIGSNVSVMIRRYDANFTALDNVVEVYFGSSMDGAPENARIAALQCGGFVVVFSVFTPAFWQGTYRFPYVDTYPAKGQVFAETGAKVGQVFEVATGTLSSHPHPHAATLPDGRFIVTWADQGEPAIKARVFSPFGTPLGAEFVVTNVRSALPSVATFKDSSFVVAFRGSWTVSSNFRDDNNVGLQYFDAAHNKVATYSMVNTHYAGTQNWPVVASNWDDGDFAVFFMSPNFHDASSENDIVGQWFTADLTTPQVASPCTSACLRHFCTEGTFITLNVTGVVSNDVYGSAYFTEDSNVAAAAVYAGLVAEGETATVTVNCSGAKASFDSGSANGVTTQAFNSTWNSSFTFDLGGVTQAPPPPAPPPCYHEPCAAGQCNVQGTSFDVVVIGVVSDNIWGSSEFSDDSWLGAAAVHQGLVQPGRTASVTVTCTGPRASLTGSTRNGVATNDFGAYQYTYIVHAHPIAVPTCDPTIDMCVGACLASYCPDGDEIFLRVYGSTWGYLWGGNAPYTSDTTVSVAAVHAGLISDDETGIVKATCTGVQSAFIGSANNDVISASYGPWNTSFTLSTGTGMPTVVCTAADQCLKGMCAIAGRVIKVSVTGSTIPVTTFWGSTRYSGDSPVSHAAVHVGLVADGQTAVLYATCHGPQDTFTGSTANGVTSTSWASWPTSFTLSASL